jgi:hypothetical protein
VPISHRGALLNTLLQVIAKVLHNSLNVMLQIANEMTLQNKIQHPLIDESLKNGTRRNCPLLGNGSTCRHRGNGNACDKRGTIRNCFLCSPFKGEKIIRRHCYDLLSVEAGYSMSTVVPASCNRRREGNPVPGGTT